MKVIDLKSLWTRAAAKPKSSTASASTPLLQTVESRIQSDTPSVHLQTHNEIEVEREVASTEPQVVGDAAVIHEDQHEGIMMTIMRHFMILIGFHMILGRGLPYQIIMLMIKLP